jgi:hypothetical protein
MPVRRARLPRADGLSNRIGSSSPHRTASKWRIPAELDGPDTVNRPRSGEAALAASGKARRLSPGLLALTILLVPQEAQSDGFETYGDVGQYLIPGIALMVAAAKRDTDGVVQLGATSAATMGTTYALKYAVNRRRPNGNRQSFPSGHASAAFMGAAFLHFRYGWEYGLPAYAAASLVAASRVTSRNHHATDVVASAAIGIAAAYVLTDSIDETVTIVPFADVRKRNFGLLVNIKF